MPYIRKADRNRTFCFIADGRALTPGELNYQFTMLAKAYMDYKGLSYSVINDIVGALEGAKLEFYRRVAVPYEDQKIKENGDVY